MTEEIIIDGVNVAGCDGLNKNSLPLKQCDLLQFKTKNGGIAGRWCTDHSNCYYKQLKRLEQKSFALTQESQQKSQTICELEQENKELQAYKDINEDFKKAWDELNEKYKQLRSALEEIMQMFLNQVAWVGQLTNFEEEIYNTVNEVLK